jgi:hypothetical protein
MKPQAKVEIYYFGCCPWSYFLAYGGGFLDEEWTKTGGDFKHQLEQLGVEIVEINLFENPELAEKYASHLDPYNPFSSHIRFFLSNKEVSKEEFFAELSEPKGSC